MDDFSEESILKLLIKKSSPVMLALLIQSIYNIVDSYFIAKYESAGFTALSLFFPIQLLLTAIATGVGVGTNIIVSSLDGKQQSDKVPDVTRTSYILAVFNYLVVCIIGQLLMPAFFEISSDTELVIELGIAYGRVIVGFSFGLFLESMSTKLLQARGQMNIPMIAQVIGAVINIILDYILIFGKCGFTALGITGAATATVIGQLIAMMITTIAATQEYGFKGRFRIKLCYQIYKDGLPSILMQSLYTLYIIGLNLILAMFSDNAVTTLGIYYKLQTFFFIPMFGLQQSIVPIISYNYSAGYVKRVKKITNYSMAFSTIVMSMGMILFLSIPRVLIGIFSSSEEVMQIGSIALRVISLSFIPAALILVYTSVFQGIGKGKYTLIVTILRQIVLLVPLAWVLHYLGLGYVWFTFPITEISMMILCIYMYGKECSRFI